MTNYTVTAEVAVSPTPQRAAAWMDALANYSPAVGRTDRGHSEIVVTLPAASLEQAVSTGLAVLLRAAGQLETFAVTTTAEYDRRADDVRMPELVGATEVAQLLRVSRQRVQQMAADGSLPSRKIGGKALVFPRATVEAIAHRG